MRKLNLIVVLSLASLIGCASAPSAPEQSLEEKAQARWDHILADEYEQALAMYTPGYREITSVGEYAAWVESRPVRWQSADVRLTACEDEARCTVYVSISYRVPTGPVGIRDMEFRQDVEESWIRLGDAWYFVQE